MYKKESGYYIYLKSDQNVNIDEETTAFLEFHNLDIQILENSCLTFWYYMHVYGVVGLNVTLDDEIVWTKFAHQNGKWRKGMIDLNKRYLNNIKFIGILGNGWLGNIAIDDLYITEGTCKGIKICFFFTNSFFQTCFSRSRLTLKCFNSLSSITV